MENESATLLIFTKSGEFKHAFTNFDYSGGSQVGTTIYAEKIEVTAESIKLMISESVETQDGEVTEKPIAFYLINKDGTLTYENTQK